MHDSTSQAGRDAYDQTLAQHHSWFIKNGAFVAMYALPSKDVLLHRVSSLLSFIQTLYSLVYYIDPRL